jgi:hypothetical protein
MLKDIRKKDAVSTQIYIGSRVVAQKKKIFEYGCARNHRLGSATRNRKLTERRSERYLLERALVLPGMGVSLKFDRRLTDLRRDHPQRVVQI